MHNTAIRQLPLPLQLPLRTELQANRLLAVMPPDALERLLPHMQKVRLIAGEVLYEASAEVTHAYFPVEAIIAFLLRTTSGSTTQVSIAGNDSLAGITAFMGGTAQRSALVLSTGDAFKISASALKAEFDRNGAVMRLLLRFTQVVVTQMAQAAVCNRHHQLEQQLCGWLLACMDRLPHGNSLRVTHETMAGMLGVRREGVTEATGKLRQLGLIECGRGEIKLIGRGGLQARACECYQVVKRETDRLLPDRPAT